MTEHKKSTQRSLAERCVQFIFKFFTDDLPALFAPLFYNEEQLEGQG